VGVVVIAAVVAANRTRAGWLLFTLMGATTVSAVALIVRHQAGSAIGTIVAAAA
jgi:hypothetical protein